MFKDFDGWNKRKKEINEHPSPLFNENEIWGCFLGVNIGSEQDGKAERFMRPVLIIKKFNKDVFWGLPLTHSFKSNPYYHRLSHNSESNLCLSQLKLIDAKRLSHMRGKITSIESNIIKEKLRKLLF